MQDKDALNRLAKACGEKLRETGKRLVIAESCTGGGLAYALTRVSGASHWFDRGYVTYSNRSKMDCLGVSQRTLEQFGAVSEETIREMAMGAITLSGAHFSVAITGIAGPEGGTPEKPVGLVWFGFAQGYSVSTQFQHFEGDRDAIRQAAIRYALENLQNLLVSGSG